jgi:hypothetical protein
MIMILSVGHQLARGLAIVLVFLVPILAIIWWLNRRDRRRWELQEQLREMEQQIWLETLPDWQREAILESRQQQADIAREARRRLGLPEEER